MVSAPNGGYGNLTVLLNELNDALRYGRTSEQLKKMVQDEKEKCSIEN